MPKINHLSNFKSLQLTTWVKVDILIRDDLRQEGVEIAIGYQLPAKLLALLLLVIQETLDDGIENGMHHLMITRRVASHFAIPDFSERGHVSRGEDRPFEQAVLQLRQAVRINILTDRRRLIVGFERFVDVLFLIGEIEDEGKRLSGRDAVEP